MNSITAWSYEDSVRRVRPMVMNWRNLTVEIVEELYRAREELRTSEHGGRPKTVPNGTVNSWSQYLDDVGLARTTVHRWLERYVPEENRILEPEELEERKRIADRATQDKAVSIRKRVVEAINTGVKPTDWDSETEKAYHKELKERKDRDKRIDDAKADMERARIRREEEKAKYTKTEEDSIEDEALRRAADMFIEQSNTRRAFKEKIRVSQSGGQDFFIDALMDYLDSLDDDNRRIEACYNVIKVAKNIAVELQRKGAR